MGLLGSFHIFKVDTMSFEEKKKKRIKRKWERWLEIQDGWTRGEIVRRDRWLRKLCLWTHPLGLTANRLTAWSTGLIGIWVILYDGLGVDLLFLHLLWGGVIGAMDAWDGSQARNNDNVTGKGAMGDHFRDLGYALYMERVALNYGMPVYFMLVFIVLEAGTLYFKWCAFYKYAESIYTWEKLFDFAEENFQNTGYDRLQAIIHGIGLAVLSIGYTFAHRLPRFEFLDYELPLLVFIGLALILIAFGLGIANIYKEMGWSPLPPESS